MIDVILTGRPLVFFQVFAVLKATREVWGVLARTFGWKLRAEHRLAAGD